MWSVSHALEALAGVTAAMLGGCGSCDVAVAHALVHAAPVDIAASVVVLHSYCGVGTSVLRAYVDGVDVFEHPPHPRLLAAVE